MPLLSRRQQPHYPYGLPESNVHPLYDIVHHIIDVPILHILLQSLLLLDKIVKYVHRTDDYHPYRVADHRHTHPSSSSQVQDTSTSSAPPSYTTQPPSTPDRPTPSQQSSSLSP